MTKGSIFSKMVLTVIALGVIGTLTMQMIILTGMGFGAAPKQPEAGKMPNPSKFGTVPKITADLFEDIKNGGYTIFIRHAKKTDGDGNTRSALDRGELFADIGKHPSLRLTCLNKQGEAEAWLLSQFFKKTGIPVGAVYSSPICRAQETAKIVLPAHEPKIVNGLVYPHVGATDAEKFKILEVATKLVESAPEKGKNKFVFAHGRILTQLGSVPGKRRVDRFKDIKEAGVSFLKHDEDGKIVSDTSTTLKDLIFALPLDENLNQQ